MKYSADSELVAGCVRQDRTALEQLVMKFSDPVYRSIQYTCKARNIPYSIQDLEDMHNSVFLSLFENRCKKLSQFKGKNGCSLHTWIRLITVRAVIDHLRKQGKDAVSHRHEGIETELLNNIRGDSPDVLEEIDKKESIALIQKGMRQLPPRETLFLKLFFQDNLTIYEIAQIMNITEENAYSIKHRAIKRLREAVWREVE